MQDTEMRREMATAQHISLETLKTVTAELTKPFNVLAPFIKGASMKEFANAGAKRVSVGGAKPCVKRP